VRGCQYARSTVIALSVSVAAIDYLARSILGVAALTVMLEAPAAKHEAGRVYLAVDRLKGRTL
jgi:hypothetical protein